MESLDIGYLYYPTLGGSGYMASRLAEQMCKRGHEVHIFTYKRPLMSPKDGEGWHYHEVPIIDHALFQDTGAPFSLTEAGAVIRAVKENGINLDIIHAHYAIPHVLAADIIARELGVSSIITLHGSDVHSLGRQSILKYSLASVLNRQTEVTAVSNYLASLASETFSLNKEIKVIHNFIDADVFKPKPRKSRMHTPKDYFLITHASNFRPIKNVILLLEAFRRFSKDKTNVHLDLIGTGPDRERAERYVNYHDLSLKVSFLGVREDVPALFSNSDVLVVSSRNESFSLTAAEAMACSTPVIATRVGGLPEVVRDGIDGLLIESENVNELVAALEQLYKNPGERMRLGRNAREQIIKKFDVTKIVNSYENLYRNAVEKKSVQELKESGIKL